MRFYNEQHEHYCGVDLHTRMMYLCILDQAGEILLHRNIRANPEEFLAAVEPYREDLVVGVECIFTWYWLADLCDRESIHFVLGHALYMKAVHGGKTKNDRIDAHKIAAILRGGNLPVAYAYPVHMRATRDLLRRRTHLMRKRSELMGHIQNTASQYNLPSPGKLTFKRQRVGVAEAFLDTAVRRSVELDLSLIDIYDPLLQQLEKELVATAKVHDPTSFKLLKSIPGVGKILGLTLLYEIHDIGRFPRVQDFSSYARLIGGTRESCGKPVGGGGRKIGNPHLKWAFSEAAVCLLNNHLPAQKLKQRLMRRHGKGKAMAIIAHKVGRTVYHVLKRQTPFDAQRFLNTN
jgi:transposase